MRMLLSLSPDELLSSIKLECKKLEDDWRAENLDYEEVASYSKSMLNERFEIDVSSKKGIKRYKITDCYIFDDFDNLAIEIFENVILLDITYKCELKTKTLNKSINSKIQKTSTFLANIRFEYILFQYKIIRRKFVSMNIEANI